MRNAGIKARGSLMLVAVLSVALGACVEGERCTKDHDEFYEYRTEGIDDVLRLTFDGHELDQQCNTIPFYTAAGGFQSADTRHIVGRLEVRSHLVPDSVPDYLIWRVFTHGGGEMFTVTSEIFEPRGIPFTEEMRLLLEERDLYRNVRIEASLHMVNEETGGERWAVATGMGLITDR